MAQYKIPSFLMRKSQEMKEKMMPEYLNVIKTDCVEMYVEYLEGQLDRLLAEEEKTVPSTDFELAFKIAQNRGKREVLRKIIKDLKG